MKAVGIVCEYNPFHNGHIYHINKIREMYPDYIIVLVMSGNFTQRGDVSVIDKWDKTDIALNYVDLVVELPFPFATSSADTFAYGATGILKALDVSVMVFGAESLTPDELRAIADAQKKDDYNKRVLKYMNDGNNYPTSLSKAVYDFTKIKISSPNDLLGLSYVKALDGSSITPITIKRTNDYNDKNFSGDISSATSIRNGLRHRCDVSDYVPLETMVYLKKHLHYNFQYFDLLKYKIISEIDHLDRYLNVDEGIENRIRKYIYGVSSLEELISKVKCKRFTYNKLNRMFTYILCGYTKEDARKYKKLEYIRVLGFNKCGRKYLKAVKEYSSLPIITKYTSKYKSLSIEMKASFVYYSKEKDKIDLTLMEYKHKPIIK